MLNTLSSEMVTNEAYESLLDRLPAAKIFPVSAFIKT